MVEKLTNANGDVLNYTNYSGNDEVLQHKKHGLEMAHITLHPDGVYVRTKRGPAFATELKKFVKSNLAGFSPTPSINLKNFIRKVKNSV